MNKNEELPLILELIMAFCDKYGITYERGVYGPKHSPCVDLPDWGIKFCGGITPGKIPNLEDLLVQGGDVILQDYYSDENGPNATFSIIKIDSFADPGINLDILLIKYLLGSAWARDNSIRTVEDFLRYVCGGYTD